MSFEQQSMFELEDKISTEEQLDSDMTLRLWEKLIELEGQQFTTSGRGTRPGVSFTYQISRNTGASGRHYNGQSVDSYGNELWIIDADGEKREKSISRSTVELGYRRAIEMDGRVSGPKKLGIPGAGSYLYPIFVEIGVIRR